jgi:hypothetical protein
MVDGSDSPGRVTPNGNRRWGKDVVLAWPEAHPR